MEPSWIVLFFPVFYLVFGFTLVAFVAGVWFLIEERRAAQEAVPGTPAHGRGN